jgi:hypothetical protein
LTSRACTQSAATIRHSTALLAAIEFIATFTMTPPFDSNHLNALLAAELVAGNAVHQDDGGWGSFRRLVVLKRPFRALRSSLALGLEHHVINDPHYWQAEVVDTHTSEMLACGFDRPA